MPGSVATRSHVCILAVRRVVLCCNGPRGVAAASPVKTSRPNPVGPSCACVHSRRDARRDEAKCNAPPSRGCCDAVATRLQRCPDAVATRGLRRSRTEPAERTVLPSALKRPAITSTPWPCTGPGADAGGVSPVPAQMRAGGEPSPGADAGRGRPVPVQMGAGEPSPGADAGRG
jgi:hypothetical protein